MKKVPTTKKAADAKPPRCPCMTPLSDSTHSTPCIQEKATRLRRAGGRADRTGDKGDEMG